LKNFDNYGRFKRAKFKRISAASIVAFNNAHEIVRESARNVHTISPDWSLCRKIIPLTIPAIKRAGAHKVAQKEQVKIG
jgi:hypothetical protein